MDVYIKPKQKAVINGRKIIYVKDAAEVYSTDESIEGIRSIPVYTVKEDKKKNYALSVIDIIRCITQKYPDLTVNNVGETDVLIQYSPRAKEQNTFLLWLKIAFVSVVLFIGAATAIMSFQSDGEISKIMEGYYNMFYGKTEHSPWLLEIPYSIGLAVGITVFFNHFSRSKESKDPTPIEIQMTVYEQQTVSSMIDSIENEKGV